MVLICVCEFNFTIICYNYFSDDMNNLTDSKLNLASFLIQRACANSSLANYFYWYLLIECEDQDTTVKQDRVVRDMYLTVMKTFSKTLAKGTFWNCFKILNFNLEIICFNFYFYYRECRFSKEAFIFGPTASFHR